VIRTKSPVNFRTVSIYGPRVQLSPISDAYADEIFAEFTDEITRLMIPPTPKSVDEIRDFIRRCHANIENGTDLTFTILNRCNSEFLGVCGLHGIPDPQQPMLGIWLKKSAHGNKYGQEAIAALVEWARSNLVYDYLVYPCDEANLPSRKIAETLNGSIFRKGKVKSMSGRELNEIAYKIA